MLVPSPLETVQYPSETAHAKRLNKVRNLMAARKKSYAAVWGQM